MVISVVKEKARPFRDGLWVKYPNAGSGYSIFSK